MCVLQFLFTIFTSVIYFWFKIDDWSFCFVYFYYLDGLNRVTRGQDIAEPPTYLCLPNGWLKIILVRSKTDFYNCWDTIGCQYQHKLRHTWLWLVDDWGVASASVDGRKNGGGAARLAWTCWNWFHNLVFVLQLN